MYKTVIFDLGGVIVPLDFPRGYAAIAPHTRVPLDEIPKRIRASGLVPRLETGELDAADFIAQFSAELGLSVAADEFRRIWSSIFPPHTLIPETLLSSIKQNYRLLLLSNTNSIHFEMILENYPLLGHFDHYVLSYRVGALKPSPRIYEEALAHAGCRQDECFYTDDIAAYVDGARQAGIDAVQFQSCEQLMGEFDRRGIRY